MTSIFKHIQTTIQSKYQLFPNRFPNIFGGFSIVAFLRIAIVLFEKKCMDVDFDARTHLWHKLKVTKVYSFLNTRRIYDGEMANIRSAFVIQ